MMNRRIRPRALYLARLVRSAALATALAVVPSCAHVNEDASVCPEYRDLRCATAPECSMDERRGCRVCACSVAGPAGPSGRLPSAVAPDRRTPQQ